MNVVKKLEVNKDKELRMLRCFYGTLRDIFWHSMKVDLCDYVGGECFFLELGEEYSVPVFLRQTEFDVIKMLERYGFKFEEVSFEDSTKAWDDLYQNLNLDIFSIVYLDSYHFPYSIHHKSAHTSHCLCITGIKEDENIVTLHDPGFKFYNKEVEKDVIDFAWKKHGYKKINIIPTTDHEVIGFEDFKRIIKTNVQNMFNPDYEYLYRNAFPDNHADKYLLKAGLEGIYYLGQILETITDDEEIMKNLLMVSETFARITEQTEMHAVFLHNMAKKFSLTDWKDKIEEIDYIAQQWKLLKNMVTKANFRNTEQILIRCKNKVQAIAEMEKRYLEGLDEAIRRV